MEDKGDEAEEDDGEEDGEEDACAAPCPATSEDTSDRCSAIEGRLTLPAIITSMGVGPPWPLLVPWLPIPLRHQS